MAEGHFWLSREREGAGGKVLRGGEDGRIVVLIYEDQVRERSTCRAVGRMGSEIRRTGAEIGRVM